MQMNIALKTNPRNRVYTEYHQNVIIKKIDYSILIRCKECDRLLLKAEEGIEGKIQIKCRRCGNVNEF